MDEVTVDTVPQKARDMFNKGFSAFEHGSLDYAIDMFTSCVEMEPAFHQARRYMRAAEIRRLKREKVSGMQQAFEALASLPTYLQAHAAIRSNKPQQALELSEKLMRQDPLNLRFVRLFVSAAGAADLKDAAIQTLEAVREHYPSDTGLLNLLGSMYLTAGRTRDARGCFERLVELHPHDPKAVKLLKDSLALDSMASDGWSSAAKTGDSFRTMIKDEDEAVRLEQQAKAVKTDKDADDLIADAKSKIEKEPENINYYRQLARLYTQRKMYNEAIQTLDKALEISPGDPEVDNTRSATRLMLVDHEIEQLRAAGDTAGADAKQAERSQFAFDDLQERVKRYPNEMRLRYDLGVVLYENGYLNEAIQQFQLSQRNQKYRIRSLYYLGMSFKKKKQFDMGLQQLETAVSELGLMDDEKKEICYEIGLLAEEVGDKAKALEYLKKIYQADIGYKDVAQRVEKAYSR